MSDGVYLTMNILRSKQEISKIIEDSKTSPVFLLKHSLICPISSAAYSAFGVFSENNPEITCYVVHIQENRDISNHIAEETGIRHASPQAILLSGGNAVWNESHYGITGNSLKQALT